MMTMQPTMSAHSNYGPMAPQSAGRYEANRVLGTGTYGQVLRCTDHETKQAVAVKIVKPEPAYRLSAQNEVHVLRHLQHCPHVLKYLNSFEVDHRIHIVSELLGHNLYEVLQASRFHRMSLYRVRDVARAVMTALAELHKLGYMHCDVKPENVMTRGKDDDLSDVVMIDFGAVRKLQDNQYYDVQSLWYRAPEVMCGLPYTPKIDAWSIGCLLYELHTGSPLFPGDNEADALAQIVAVVGRPSQTAMVYGKNAMKYNFEPSPDTDPYVLQTSLHGDDHTVAMFRDLLCRLLCPDETNRLSVAEALNHPFLFAQEPGCGMDQPSNSSMVSAYLAADEMNSPMTSPATTVQREDESSAETSVRHLTPPLPIDEWDFI